MDMRLGAKREGARAWGLEIWRTEKERAGGFSGILPLPSSWFSEKLLLAGARPANIAPVSSGGYCCAGAVLLAEAVPGAFGMLK
jgi:hypothetical protein